MARYLVATALVTLALVCARASHAQTMADSVVEALSQNPDEILVDNETLFDEIESLADATRVQSRSRAILDPRANDELGNTSGRYLGTSAATLEKIELRQDLLAAGFAAQKDAWEQSYIDDWAGYLELRRPVPAIGVSVDRAVIGNYALRFGSGLIFGSGFGSAVLRTSPGHLLAGQNPLRHSLSPHSTTALLGGSTAISFGNVSIIPFFSSRHLDARVDTLGVRALTTYPHRTIEEARYKNALGVSVRGVHASYADSAWNAGLTVSHTAYDQPLQTSSSRVMKGRTLDHAGLNATSQLDRVQFDGEAAIARADSSTGLGAIASLRVEPTEGLSLLGIYHREDTNYFAPLAATAVSSESDITNNEGYWLGLGARLSEGLQLTAGLDVSWRLQSSTITSLATPQQDEFVNLEYTARPGLRLSTRYRERHQTLLTTIWLNGLSVRGTDERDQSNARIICRYDALEWLGLQFRMEGTRVRHSLDANAVGGVLQLMIAVRLAENRVKLSLARFSTDNYDSRVYGYAAEVPGLGSILTMSGNGYFIGVSGQAHATRAISLEAYFGGYCYDHVRGIGSGVTARTGASDLTAALQLTLTP